MKALYLSDSHTHFLDKRARYMKERNLNKKTALRVCGIRNPEPYSIINQASATHLINASYPLQFRKNRL